MRIGWAVLAEGIVQDGEGAFSLIRVNRNILFAEAFPAQVKRSVLVHLEAEPGEDPTRLNPVTFNQAVRAPNGNVLTANTGHGELAGFPFPEIPGGVDVPVEFSLQIANHGEHKIEVSITFADGTQDHCTVSLFVMQASAGVQAEPT